MIAFNQYTNNSANRTGTVDVPLDGFFTLSELAGYQPYITTPDVGTYSNRIQVVSGTTVLLDATITATRGPAVGGVESVATGSVSWAVGPFPTPDVPTLAFGATTRDLPVSQGGSVAGYAADYQVIYTPPGSVVRIMGTGFNVAGVGLSTRPQAAFSNSGTTTGAVSVDGSGSQDGVSPFATPTYIDDPNNNLTAYIWNWGDGTTDTTTTPTASHEYSDSGTYTVTLEVRDKYAGRNRTSQSVTITADGGRLVSLCVDASGFLVRGKMTASPKALVTERHNGLQWEQTHSTTLLQKPGYSTPRDQSPIYRVTQVVSSKVWQVESSPDLGGSWNVVSVPFDSSYKAVSRIAWGLGCAMIVGIDSTNVLRVKTSTDLGKTWQTAYNGTTLSSPGSASKSVDCDYDYGRSRFICVADATLSKYQADETGVAAWVTL